MCSGFQHETAENLWSFVLSGFIMRIAHFPLRDFQMCQLDRSIQMLGQFRQAGLCCVYTNLYQRLYQPDMRHEGLLDLRRLRYLPTAGYTPSS